MFSLNTLRSLLISLPLFLLSVQAAVLNATWSSSTDVAVTAASYTATGHTVNFTLNHTPVTGRNLTVVNNTGLAFIQGIFGNLSQGQQVTFTYAGNPYKFVANYYGGTGNDLVLQWAAQSITAWGWNGAGQLGNNSTTYSGVPVAANTTGVLNGKTVVAVSAGSGSHNLALCSDGTVAAWGFNDNGQLGINSFTNSIVPVAVNTSGVLSGKTVVAVSAGTRHSLALCSDGTVAAWGQGTSGQLGNNSTTTSSVPVAVDTTGALSGKTVVAVAAGGHHSLALCSDGSVAAWGSGGGRLGNNSTTTSSVPVAVDTTGVLNGKTVVAVAAGFVHSLALCSDGTVAAWGINTSGQLGNNSTTTGKVPVAVNTTGVLSGKTVVAVAVGVNHSLALCSDGTVAAWGSNGFGQLGNNSTTSSSVPVAVNTTGVLSGKTVVTVAAGGDGFYYNRNFSLALCSDGSVVAWGSNDYGQLGTGGTGSGNVPVAVNTTGVLSGKTVVAVAAGEFHSLALAAGELSKISTLSGLALNSGNLSPSFSSGTKTYTASVPLSTTSITVTPIVTDLTAIVRLNGNLIASGSSSVIQLLEGSNSITVLVTAQDGVTTTTYTVTVTRATAYELWKISVFTSQADRDNPAVSGPNATPAGDGITNLMKYALGLNPLVCGSGDLPESAVQDGYLALTYRRSQQATDVTYKVEASDSLDGNWSATNAVVSQVDMGGYWEITVRDTVPIATNSKRFMRLKVDL